MTAAPYQTAPSESRAGAGASDRVRPADHANLPVAAVGADEAPAPRESPAWHLAGACAETGVPGVVTLREIPFLPQAEIRARDEETATRALGPLPAPGRAVTHAGYTLLWCGPAWYLAVADPANPAGPSADAGPAGPARPDAIAGTTAPATVAAPPPSYPANAAQTEAGQAEGAQAEAAAGRGAATGQGRTRAVASAAWSAEPAHAALPWDADGPGIDVVDSSAARTVLELRGSSARDVLSHGCRVDLHPRVFPPGATARTLLARATVVVHHPDVDTYRVYVGASYADHLTRWLLDAMTPYVT